MPLPARDSIAVRDPADLGALVGTPGETLAETLRRTLLEMIIFGYFDPGSRLYPEKIAEHFGVSLTPVREALMRLAAEGFVEAIQRRGYHLRAPDAKQVVDLWHVRLAVEMMAGELLIGRLRDGRLSETALAAIEEIQDRLEADAATIGNKERHELNGHFHQRIVELSDNDRLIATYRGIQLQLFSAWIQRGIDFWRARHASESQEHRAILAALRARDAAAHEQAVRRHIARSLKDALADLAAREADAMTATAVATTSRAHPAEPIGRTSSHG